MEKVNRNLYFFIRNKTFFPQEASGILHRIRLAIADNYGIYRGEIFGFLLFRLFSEIIIGMHCLFN